MVALLIEDRLRGLGYTTIDFATTEDDAIAQAQAHRPDLITSDVRLIAGCGITAVQAICSLRDIPVVFITATAWEVRNRMPGSVVVDKPFAGAQIDCAIATCLGLGHRSAC